MPLQNRVTPFGEIIATEARGTLMGNRGCLHDAHMRLGAKLWERVAWITCTLKYGDIHRVIMQPGQYTELFFLDEATAFAAGHRPCWECRREAFYRFRDAWAQGNGRVGERVTAADMDACIHADRLDTQGNKLTYEARLGDLPDGVCIALDGTAHMKVGDFLYPWSPFRYGQGICAEGDVLVPVVTPHSIVNAFYAGYAPDVHRSIGQ